MAQNINKVVYAGETLLDLTADTVNASSMLSGVTAHDKSGAVITGSCTFDSDTKDATVAVAEMLTGKTAYARGAKLTGTMPNRGGDGGYISTVDGEYTISQGYHDGSGKVAIDSTEQAKIVPGNIRQGVEVLGVTGTMSGSEDVHAQSLSVTPTKNGFAVTPEEGYNYLTQVTVAAIPYVESDNAAGGKTVTIA